MEQRSPEWFAARRGRITASMAGAILGNSPNMTREGAMRAMVREWHGAAREFEGNVATEYGTFNESGALVEYEMETGNTVTAEGFVTRAAWAGCSPDGLIGLLGGLEIKCPFGKRKWQEGDTFKTLEEQPHYYDQVQFSLWVTTRAWWDFFQWAPGATDLERVEPDAAWRSKNIKKLIDFHDDFIAERGAPNCDKHLEPKRVEIDTLEAKRLLTEYDELSEAIDNAKDRLAEVKDQLTGLCGDRSGLVCGRNVTRVERVGAVAYAKALKAIAPDADLAPYRGKPSISWRIT